MILSYVLDPNLVDFDIALTKRRIKHLFQAVLIIDKNKKLEAEYKKIINEISTNNPIKSGVLDYYLFPENSFVNTFTDFTLEKKLCANFTYEKNFNEFVLKLVSAGFILDFVLTTEENKKILINDLKKISNSKKIRFLTEKKFEDKTLKEQEEYDQSIDFIEEIKNKKIKLPDDNDQFYRLMSFSDYLEISLQEWPSNIQASRQYTQNYKENFKVENFNRGSFSRRVENYEELTRTYKQLHLIEDIINSFIKKQRRGWKYSKDSILIQNTININGDQFLEHLLSFSYFLDIYIECIQKNQISYINHPQLVLVLPQRSKVIKSKKEASSIPWRKIFKELIERYIEVKYSKYDVIPEIEFKFLPEIEDNKKKSKATHMRYILTKQNAIDLRTSSIFTSTLIDKRLDLKSINNFNDFLDNLEFVHKDSEFSIIRGPAKPNHERNTELDDFMSFRGTRNA